MANLDLVRGTEKTTNNNPTSEFRTQPCLVEKRQLQKKYTGSWVWRTIASLIEISDFTPSSKWIAQRLNITVDEVVSALEGLEGLGIIRRTPSGYEKVLKFVYYSDRDLEPKSILMDHVMISTQILGRLDPIQTDIPSFYRTGFIATNKELTKDFFNKVEQLFKEYMEASSESASDMVFAISLSGIDVSGKENEREKNE